MKFHLGHLLGFSAVILAISAAFFSVTGLGQLFAGASLAVIIMASALEVSKIIIATFLHRHWSEISTILKTYLTIGVIVLVGITSAGIYGFLSSAYQKTATELEIHENQVGLIDNKIELVQDKISDNDKVVNTKIERYNKLMDLRTVQEVRLDSMINRRYFSNANKTREEIERASNEMKGLQADIDLINGENSKLKDSISKFQIQKMEMKASSVVAGEVGPLKYLADLTNQPMDTIVNYFTLLLIFVFDPLAISLVVATNWVFGKKRKEKIKNKVKSNTEPDTGELDSSYSNTEVEQDVFAATPMVGEELEDETDTQNVESGVISEPVEEDEEPEELGPDTHDIEVNEPEEVKPEEDNKIETEPKRKLSLEDIDISGPYSNGDRGFSTTIPDPKFNDERKLGTNKVIKNGNQIVYKNTKNGKK